MRDLYPAGEALIENSEFRVWKHNCLETRKSATYTEQPSSMRKGHLLQRLRSHFPYDFTSVFPL